MIFRVGAGTEFFKDSGRLVVVGAGCHLHSLVLLLHRHYLFLLATLEDLFVYEVGNFVTV